MSLSSKNDKLLDAIEAGLKPGTGSAAEKKRGLPSSGHSPGTAVGMMVGSANETLRTKLAESEARAQSLADELAHAQVVADEKARELAEAKVVLFLDPARVRRSRYADRHPNAFVDKDFKELCDEIKSTGGNEESAKVRPVKGDPNFDYELASGHRRHAACLELGLRLKAECHDYTDEELLKQMRLENSGRTDLSAFEVGRHYAGLLADKLFNSGRDLAAKLDVAQSVVQRLLKFAELPEEVIAAFPDPREIRIEWVERLAASWQNDRARVETEIAGLAGQAGLRAATIYARITGRQSRNKVITREGAVLGRIRMVHGCPAVVLYKDAPEKLLARIQELVVNWRDDEDEDGSGT